MITPEGFCDEGCFGCWYCYGDLDWCMYGEDDIPDYMPKNCEGEILDGYREERNE